jgi:hypothetical protein
MMLPARWTGREMGASLSNDLPDKLLVAADEVIE